MKIRVHLSVGLCGCDRENVIEVDDAEWQSMTEAEQDEYCRDAVFNFVDWGWSVVE